MSLSPPATKDIGLGTKLAYGVGSIAYGAKVQILGALLFYYNQLEGLPAHWVSWALGAAVVIDALWDLMVGQISDNTRTRIGRRHPFMYASALPVALCVVFMLNPPAGLSHMGLLIYMASLAIGSRLMISLYEIPNTALVAELAPDYDKRTTLLSFRYLFQTVGTVLAIVLANYVFLRPHNGEPGQFYKAGYAPLALTVGIVMFASIIVSSLGTHHQIAGLRVQHKRQVPFSQVLGEIWLTVSNRNFVVLASAGMIFGITVGLSGGLTPYFNTYLWGLGTKQIGTIQLSALISALPAVILAPILARRFGKKRVCITLFFIAILTLAAPISGKLLGLTPPSGSTALVFFLAANHMLVSGLSMMGFIIVTSMIADIVEETELRTGRRSEGLLFAADTFLQKVSTGVATFLPGLMVTYVGLPVHARPKTLDPAIMIHLATLYLPMAIGLMLCSTTCIFFYRIDRAQHEDNLRRLADAAAFAEKAEEMYEQALPSSA